jgi:hypothetical protein
MERLGLVPLLKETNQTTATGTVSGESRSQSDMQSWVSSLESTFEEILKVAAKINAEAVDQDLSVDIFSEFALSIRSSEDIRAIQESRKEGDIDQMTVLQEMKRRGVVAPTTDLDSVMTETKKEREEQRAREQDMLRQEKAAMAGGENDAGSQPVVPDQNSRPGQPAPVTP